MKQLVLSVFIFLWISSVAQDVRFKMEYQTGAQQPIGGSGLHQMPDSGFIFCSTDGTFSTALVLNRTNKWGQNLWSKRYPFTNSSYYNQLIRFSDNRFAIFTGTEIARIDSLGNVIWSIELDSGYVYAAPAKNDALILQGWRNHPTTEKMMTAAKIDSSGNLLWSTSVDSLITNGIDALTAVPLSNGSEVYMLLGTCYNEYNNYEAVTCISESGVLLWNHLFDPWLGTVSVCTTPDSCALLAGYTRFDSIGNTGIYLLKLRPDGSVVYSKAIGPFSFASPQVTVDDDQIVVTGTVVWPIQGRIFSICLDTSLNILWQREVYGSNANITYGCNDKPVICSDGGYALLCGRQSIGNGPYNLCIAKSNNAGNALCTELNTAYTVVDIPYNWINDYYQYPYATAAYPDSILPGSFDIQDNSICTSVGLEPENTMVNLKLYPNPVADVLTIESGHPSEKEIVLYNVLGEQVLRTIEYGSTVQVNVSSLATGTYAISVNGRFQSERLVVMSY